MQLQVTGVQIGSAGQVLVRLVLFDDASDLQVQVMLKPEAARALAGVLTRIADESEHKIVLAGTLPPGQPGKA